MVRNWGAASCVRRDRLAWMRLRIVSCPLGDMLEASSPGQAMLVIHDVEQGSERCGGVPYRRLRPRASHLGASTASCSAALGVKRATSNGTCSPWRGAAPPVGRLWPARRSPLWAPLRRRAPGPTTQKGIACSIRLWVQGRELWTASPRRLALVFPVEQSEYGRRLRKSAGQHLRACSR